MRALWSKIKNCIFSKKFFVKKYRIGHFKNVQFQKNCQTFFLNFLHFLNYGVNLYIIYVPYIEHLLIITNLSKYIILTP